ncbi:hypothetical protein ACVWYH_001734 [Bradyrhizobium sp. GM24.11]
MQRRQHADHFAGVHHLMRDAGMMREPEREAELGDAAEHALDDTLIAPDVEEHARLRTAAQEA